MVELDDVPIGPPPTDGPHPSRSRRGGWLVAAALAALVGAFFAGLSTHDFITHLDGQIHAVHCSVMPGDDAIVGQSGCKDAMLSPWSSFFRRSIWGGLPVSVAALAVFAFLAALSIAILLRRNRTRHDTFFLFAGAMLPAVASIIWAVIAATQLGDFCQVCVGMYASSGLLLVLAVVAHVRAEPAGGTPRPWGRWGLWFGEGTAAVAALVVLYLALVPSERKSLAGCGRLVMTEDKKGVLLQMPGEGITPALSVIDPLCPSCRAFDQRLASSGLDAQLNTRILLFPLDSRCNWMVKQSLHPGACALSEAMLCAPEQAKAILDWAFADQERLLTLGAHDPAAIEREVAERFPAVSGCVGTSKAKDRVTSSLRFAVANALPVVTPQLYVDDVRLCDEDTDLGLEYTLNHMLNQRAEAGAMP
ncbi:MAG: hypothetical protein CVU56_06325 [Deltaproteobacteria bacterium HGW-Deltaproteobacteria-14]|nr:MAG: hypothetical protein CVU56_06325 [Deltaproteobacteria bacterium HGW-Deltaproteobacteria-14]